MDAIFIIAGMIAIISAIMAITNHNAIHALLYMILALISISVIFYIVGAPLVAAFEIIVYAGAIMVLFIFVVMMLNIGMAEETEKKWLSPKIWIFPSILAASLLVIFMIVLKAFGTQRISPESVDPKKVGVTLFTTYLLAVEIASMLLLVGIVGTYHLGKQKKKIIHRFLVKDYPESARKDSDLPYNINPAE
jgi:NADH-quinone oxidoreductase subunit J